ncbi:ABC transporter substrate-binding protein [Paenibacillus sp. 32352]|uniref:ABC transporter substrate-binding protein n=1 Tax=Paenibacillus sp. 32352 TaxID=1969111 RepID=UPI0009ACCE84|nr:extracellular solute-binding protein [Paenibacillus sp. 32352]
MKIKKGVLPTLLGILLLTACTSGPQSPTTDVDPRNKTALESGEPAELSIYLWSLSQQEFDYIAELAKTQFPNLTLKAVAPQTSGNSIDELLTLGTMPDIFVNRFSTDLKKRDLLVDLEDYIKKYHYDTNRLEPVTLELMKNDANGMVAGIPLDFAVNALHYNKDIFDKFGLSYPKDGMTWDEVYDLAKQLTRNENGTLYRGFSDRWMDTFFAQNPFGLSYLAPDEDKAAVNNEGWRKVAENWKRFYTLPGLQFDSKTINKEEDRKVFQKGTSAMTVWAMNMQDWNFNWDVVSMPTYAEKEGIGAPASVRYLYITKSSKNKDVAFQFAAWLTHDEVQTALAKNKGFLTVLKNQEIQKAYRQNDEIYRGKHVSSFYFNKYPAVAAARKPELVTIDAQSLFIKELEKAILQGTDLNTVMRSAEESINQAIQTEKSK